MPVETISDKLDSILGTLSRAMARKGLQIYVAILANSDYKLELDEEASNYYQTEVFTLVLVTKFHIYHQIEPDLEAIQEFMTEELSPFTRGVAQDLSTVRIDCQLIDDPEWQDKANKWLQGKGINNQGRVRSDNVAPFQSEGLLFRSQSEIFLFQALKRLGVSFAPLPVFVRGGETYKRIEPDFFIFHEGVGMVVEIDGDKFHQELPAEANTRLKILKGEGVYVERIRAKDCDTPEKAKKRAEETLAEIKKIKSNR